MWSAPRTERQYEPIMMWPACRALRRPFISWPGAPRSHRANDGRDPAHAGSSPRKRRRAVPGRSGSQYPRAVPRAKFARGVAKRRGGSNSRRNSWRRSLVNARWRIPARIPYYGGNVARHFSFPGICLFLQTNLRRCRAARNPRHKLEGSAALVEGAPADYDRCAMGCCRRSGG